MLWGRCRVPISTVSLIAAIFCRVIASRSVVPSSATNSAMNELGMEFRKCSAAETLTPLVAAAPPTCARYRVLAAGCLIGGALSDWLARHTGSVRKGRATVGVAGFLLGALGFAAASTAHGPLAAVIWLALAQAALDLTVGVSWATCVDVGGSLGGTLAGFMNTASSLAAFLLPLIAAGLEQRFGSYRIVFAVAAAVYLAGGLL